MAAKNKYTPSKKRRLLLVRKADRVGNTPKIIDGMMESVNVMFQSQLYFTMTIGCEVFPHNSTFDGMELLFLKTLLK